MIPLIGMKLHGTEGRGGETQSPSIDVPCFFKKNQTLWVDLLCLPPKVSNLLMPVIIFWLTMQCHLACRWEEYYTSRALFTPTHTDINLCGKKWTDVHFACAIGKKLCVVLLIHKLNLEDVKSAYGARRPMASTGIYGGNMSRSE